MKPRNKLAETTTPNGSRLTLTEHDGDYSIRLNGQDLMASRMAASELFLGGLAGSRLASLPNPCALVAGLGLGFTLKGLLEKLGLGARVHVAELMPEVVDWNRRFLRALNGALLDDPRVEVRVEDVGKTISDSRKGQYDAIVLDIDNGPAAMVQDENARLYSQAGIRRMLAALKPGGFFAVWSAGEDKAFVKRLKQEGLRTEAVPAKKCSSSRRSAYVIYVAQNPPRK